MQNFPYVSNFEMKGKFKKSQFTHRWTQQLKRTEEIRGRQTCFVLAHTIKAIPVPRKKSRLAGYEANNTPLLWTLFLKVQIFLPLGFLIFKSGNVMKKKTNKKHSDYHRVLLPPKCIYLRNLARRVSQKKSCCSPMNTFTIYTGGLLLPLAEYGRNLSNSSCDDFWFFSIFYWGRKFENGVRKLFFPSHYWKNEIYHVSAI